MKLLLLLACLICYGATPPDKGRSTTPKSSATAQVSDADIERDIKARFARSKIASNNFQVKVQSGVATLDGTANVVQHKGIATRMARNAGARQVVNRIKVSESAKQKAMDQFGARRATVKRAP
jgi:osmotically-inducible protein OsmY